MHCSRCLQEGGTLGNKNFGVWRGLEGLGWLCDSGHQSGWATLWLSFSKRQWYHLPHLLPGWLGGWKKTGCASVLCLEMEVGSYGFTLSVLRSCFLALPMKALFPKSCLEAPHGPLEQL
jgi:hypothetical protein